MLLSSLFPFALIVASASARGRGGGGGGGGSGTSTISYSEQECYTTFLGPLYEIDNVTVAGTNGSKTTENNYYWIWNEKREETTVNYLSTLHPNVTWQMEILDVYYNGTFSLKLMPPPKNETYTYDCPELHSQEIHDMFLRIGPQSRGNVSRVTYGDTNNFYFHFGRTIFDEKCPYTPNKAFVNFESSNDNLQAGQIWVLSQKKNGDKFELEGQLTSNGASYNNYWNYVVNTTGSDNGYPDECSSEFSLRTLLANTGAKMNATVSSTTAEMAFSFIDTQKGWTITGSFSGQHWQAGPKILFDKDTITTEGETTHVQPRAPKQSFLDKYGKWIFIGVGVAVLLIVGFILWQCLSCVVGCLKPCFFCCSSTWRLERKEKRWIASQAKLQQRDAEYASHTSNMAYKEPTETVTAVSAAPIPHDPRDMETNYAVSPVVMQSYYVRQGQYLDELATAQMDLHRAQVQLASARARGNEDDMVIAEGMVAHYTAIIEHYMALR